MILATRNDHKLREFRRLLPELEFDPLPDGLDSPEESGDTYAANALIKARAAARQTNQPAFADDSGIEAEALDWAPGVRTARFAGEHATDEENLTKLHTLAPRHSRLRYVCVIAYVTPNGDEHLFEGTCEGTLAPARSGAKGFGYDPIFVPDATPSQTMADLDDDQKDAISHRGHAARKLQRHLRAD